MASAIILVGVGLNNNGERMTQNECVVGHFFGIDLQYTKYCFDAGDHISDRKLLLDH